MLDQTFEKIKKIQNIAELKLPVLFFGFAVWVSFPILGIIPLLLAIQLDLLRPSKKCSKLLSLNNLVLILIILTISLYLTSIDAFADTKVYLDIYDNLDRQSPFDNYISKDRFEVVLFLFFAVIHYLSNESTFWCLFSFALFNNSVIVFYISKNLSPRYYPTLLIILFSSYFYYSQVFYMRQFFSLVFVLAAIVSMESNWILFWIFSLLAIFSHTSSLIYIGVCSGVQSAGNISRIIKKIKWRKKDKIFLLVALGLAVITLLYLGLQIYNNPKSIYRFIDSILELVPKAQITRSIQGRVENNDRRDTELFSLNIFLAIAILSVGIFIVSRNYKKITLKIWSFISIYLVSLLQILFILVTGFNQRIAYLFLAFFGLFFCIGLDDQKLNEPNKIKNFAVVSAITIFMAASNTFNFIGVQAKMQDIVGITFFDKHPLGVSLFDYIVYFFQSI